MLLLGAPGCLCARRVPTAQVDGEWGPGREVQEVSGADGPRVRADTKCSVEFKGQICYSMTTKDGMAIRVRILGLLGQMTTILVA